MPNLFWYIFLATLGIGCTIFTIFIKRDIYKVSTLLVFFLYTAGLTWIGEFIVLGFFNSYTYKIGVFNDIWAQNLLGHLILNTTLYPAAAILVVAHSWRYKGIFCILIFLYLVENWFLKMGIYEHHWWKNYMTIISAIIFLLIATYWFRKINTGCVGLTRAITFFFVALVITHTPAPILLLMGKQYYHVNFINYLFDDRYLSSIIIIFIYHVCEAFLLVILTCTFKKWYFKLLPFIISIIAQIIFLKLDILVMENGWNLFLTLLIFELFIAAFILIEKYTLKPQI